MRWCSPKARGEICFTPGPACQAQEVEALMQNQVRKVRPAELNQTQPVLGAVSWQTVGWGVGFPEAGVPGSGETSEAPRTAGETGTGGVREVWESTASSIGNWICFHNNEV